LIPVSPGDEGLPVSCPAIHPQTVVTPGRL